MEIVTEKQFEIRFSEVDVMQVVWHGSYPLYLEDAREAFGLDWGLSYQQYMDIGIYAPIVEMNIKYKQPLRYGMHPVIRIKYVPTNAAKVIFDYEIITPDDGIVRVTARTVQVFMDKDGQLLWFSPEFYEKWKQKVGIE